VSLLGPRAELLWSLSAGDEGFDSEVDLANVGVREGFSKTQHEGRGIQLR
jgi:hypothetical protein